MKYKHLFALFLLGLLITIAGALVKIMHFEFGPITANLLLIAGMSAKALAIILLLVKMLKNNGNDSILNQ